MHKTALLLIACLGGLAACDDDVDNDLDGTDTETESETETEAEAPVNVEMSLMDFSTGKPISDVLIKHDDESYTTDATGAVNVPASANGAMEIVAAKSGYPDTYWHFELGPDDFGLSTFLVSRQATAQIVGALGQKVDPSKGTLVVTIFGGETGYVGGSTIELDADYGAVVVANNDSQIGFSPGNTTIEGSPAWVVFLNVDAGDVASTLTVADSNLDCVVYPDGADDMVVPVRGDSFVHITYKCR